MAFSLVGSYGTQSRVSNRLRYESLDTQFFSIVSNKTSATNSMELADEDFIVTLLSLAPRAFRY